MILIPFPEFETTLLPAPVTVHCAVGGRWPPYSSGKRNCLSLEQKWLDVAQTTQFIPPSTSIAPAESESAIVEQAPKRPIDAISKSLSAKAEPIH